MPPWLRIVQVALVTLAVCVGTTALRAQEAPEPVPEEALEPAPAAESDTAPAGLVEARAAIGGAQFAEALTALERALQEGSVQPEHLQEIYRLRGETQVAVGAEQEAKEAFKVLLVLNSEAKLGEFVSPKIAAVLDEARNELAGGALVARHQFDSKSRRLEVTVDSDPLAMTAKVRLTYPREGASAAELSIPLELGKAIFDVPGQAGSGAELALLDRNGNVLSLWPVEDLPVVVSVTVRDPKSGVVTSSSPPLWSEWWVWAGAGAAFATVGTVFGIASSSAQSDLDDVIANPAGTFFSDAKRLEDKAQSRATWANLSFATAGALGIVSGVMYWRGRDSDSVLQVAPVSDGTSASLVVGGHF